MNKLFSAAVIAATIFSANTFAQCDPGERIIKFSFVTAATGHPKGEAATAIAKRINSEMNGKACVEVFPNSTLYNDNQVLEAFPNSNKTTIPISDLPSGVYMAIVATKYGLSKVKLLVE